MITPTAPQTPLTRQGVADENEKKKNQSMHLKTQNKSNNNNKLNQKKPSN